MRGGDLGAAGEGVHPADVGVEQVDRVDALAADLGVEVGAAAAESALLEDHEHDLRREVDVGRELVGVPAEEQVARVGVDRAQGIVDAGVFEFVHHRVTGERRMIGLDVEFDNPVKSVATNEVQTGSGVEVVLMFGRLFRLWFKQELTGETDRLRVIVGHVHEAGEVIEFPLHVGVVEVVIPFATAPEDIVLAAQFVRDLNGLFDLSRCVGEDVRVAAGRSAVHVAGM